MTDTPAASRKRHCMVVHNYYPLREPRVEREAKLLAACGYDVDVICLRADGEDAVDVQHGVTIIRLPVQRHKGSGRGVQLLEYLAFFALAWVKLTALYFTRRYAVVQVHNLPDFLVFVAIVPKLAGARVILDIHDLMPEFYASRFKGSMTSWPIRLVRWQEYLACRFADQVLTVTDLWRQTLIERGVPPYKVAVVMNVAAVAGAQPDHAPDDGTFRILYHGTLTERYGIDLLLRAVDQVRRQIPDLQLIVHGAGEYGEMLVRLADELQLRDHVQFSTHFIPTPDLPTFIQQADLGVVPYRRDVFTDGILPTKLMEYVALGVPVIAARTPVIESYFDNSMVQFFEPGDSDDLARCIVALHADRSRLATLARNADRFNQQYNWTRVGGDYVALVDRLHMQRAAAYDPTY